MNNEKLKKLATSSAAIAIMGSLTIIGIGLVIDFYIADSIRHTPVEKIVESQAK